MGRYNLTCVIIMISISLLSVDALAQQTSTPRARTPRLTSDDVARSRSNPGGRHSLKEL